MSSGLEGIVVADTVLSHADPVGGNLWIRGVPLAKLVTQHCYEGATALLWEGFAGDGLTREAMQKTLGAERDAAFVRLGTWLPGAPCAQLDEAVRTCLAALPDDSSAARIAATLAVGVPALVRARAGQPLVAPDAALSTAADVLRMLHDAVPDQPAVTGFDTYLTAMMELGMGASTFAARVIASTRASLAASILGGWCAFSGPLHGGAPGPTLDLLDALAAAPDMDTCVAAKLRAGERLMGFGHRLFRGNDPRAAIMRATLRRLGLAGARLAFAEDVERRVAAAIERLKPGRRLPANVEIMAALLLDAVGVPRDAFTAIFAVSRCVSWIAHALEQQKTGRMFRPTSRYVGPPVSRGTEQNQ